MGMIKYMYPKFYFNKIHGESLITCIIWNMLLYWLIVDSFNGFFLNNGIPLPLSQLYKLILLIFLLGKLIKRNKGIVISCLFIYILVFYIHIIIIGESYIDSLLHLSKLLLTILIYIFLRTDFKIFHFYNRINRANNILKVSFIVVSINILLGLAGIGFHTYPDEQIGYKGFFFAGNEIGGLMAVLIPYFLYKVFLNYKFVKYLIACIFCVIISILLGTKSVIIISVLTCFAIPWIYGGKKVRFRIILLFSLILFMSIPYIISLINSQEFDLLVRLSYSYNKGGLSSLIFSSRDEFWELKKIEFLTSDLITKFFGLGGNRTVEMDHFDTLLNYGYLGVILVYTFYLYIFYKTWKERNVNTYSKVVVYSNLLLLSMSFIAGHILFSSMAGMFISLNNNLSIISRNNLYSVSFNVIRRR